MNKFTKILIFSVALIASGVVYQKFYRPPGIGPIGPNGNVVEINMRTLKDKWEWSPKVITAKTGDRVILHIYNEDSYDHGFSIEAFGVSERINALRTTTVDFVVSRVGTFNFYCSVSCGEGHYRHVGKFENATAAGQNTSKALKGVLIVTDGQVSRAD